MIMAMLDCFVHTPFIYNTHHQTCPVINYHIFFFTHYISNWALVAGRSPRCGRWPGWGTGCGSPSGWTPPSASTTPTLSTTSRTWTSSPTSARCSVGCFFMLIQSLWSPVAVLYACPSCHWRPAPVLLVTAVRHLPCVHTLHCTRDLNSEGITSIIELSNSRWRSFTWSIPLSLLKQLNNDMFAMKGKMTFISCLLVHDISLQGSNPLFSMSILNQNYLAKVAKIFSDLGRELE